MTSSGPRDALRTWGAIVNVAGVALVLAGLAITLRGEAVTGDEVFFLSVTIAYLAAGGILILRTPHTTVGWVVWATGFSAAVAGVGQGYFELTESSDPIGSLHTRLALFLGGLGFFMLITLAGTLLPLLFPTGRPPTRRWWWAAWAAAVGLVFMAVAELPAILTLPRDSLLRPRPPPMLNVWGGWLLACASTGALVSLIVRYRQAVGIELLQLKWFLFAVGVAVVGVSMELTLTGRLPTVALGMLIAGFVLMPVAIALAILKYHLYDIDRLISRTLAYALLTASLTAIYVVVVLVLGQLYGALGRELPSWAIAATTLGVAALFRPVRRAVQDAVDRRFNRQHYDAAVVVATFDNRLRDEVDRDTLAKELLAAVDQTMQPTARSLWLRSSSEPMQ